MSMALVSQPCDSICLRRTIISDKRPCGFACRGDRHDDAFNHAGAPALTQKWVRRVMEVAKSNTTPFGGYGGDEDQGMMGALNVLMAMGLFSVHGGVASAKAFAAKFRTIRLRGPDG